MTSAMPSTINWNIFPLLFAPIVGSFLGVLVRRVPAGRPVALARSACEACGHALAARDLVPLGSYAWLRGRCRYCGAPIGAFHLAIEFAALAVAASAVVVETDPARVWVDCGLGWSLLALAWIDWRHMLLPDALTLPLLLGGLLATAWLDPDQAYAHAAGAALGYLSLRLLGSAYRRLRGREGVGAGDAKLLGAAGAWVGWEALPSVILLSALLGLAAALALHLRGAKLERTTKLPYGPCLALAVWSVRLFGGG
jgi:leader peptidase (prepilin peptidase)/N-methyltransferase